MYILGMDTTGDTLSVALGQENNIMGSIFVNTGKKHSSTLLSAIDNLLSLCALDISQVDVFACAKGPGSYTGIRIGIATTSAFAFGGNKKVADVDILDAMIKNIDEDVIVCAMLNARNNDVYAKAKKGSEILLETCVKNVCEVASLFKEKVIFTGEGAFLYRDLIEKTATNSIFFTKPYVNAVDIVKIAFENKDNLINYDEIKPLYLRQTQAQRQKEINKKCAKGT